MRHIGMNMGQVKKQNRASILNYILATGPVSRKDIASATQLTPAAVTQICNQFIAENLLRETGAVQKTRGAGRREVLLDINYDCGYILGITIERSLTVLALANIRGDLIAKEEIKTNRNLPPKEFLSEVAKCANRILTMHKNEAKKMLGISVAIAGEVDSKGGISQKAYGIWQERVDVAGILREYFAYPILVMNNVDAFAMAELLFGIGTKYENLLVIKWGPGVGSTIIIDKEVYEGRHKRAAELGHYIVENGGEKCSCGRVGCLETIVSVQVMAKKRPFAVENFSKVYKDFSKEIDIFARAIVNAMTILAPNRVVLTGKLFRDENVRKDFIAACTRYDMSYGENRIIFSSLSEKEDYIGSIAAFVKMRLL